MVVAAEQVENQSVDADGFIGRIPVRNLWLLMLYASDLFRTRGTGTAALRNTSAPPARPAQSIRESSPAA